MDAGDISQYKLNVHFCDVCKAILFIADHE